MNFKTTLKSIIYYLFNYWITFFPSRRVRRFYLKFILGLHYGKNVNFLLGCKFRQVKNIKIGDNVVLNANVLLDGRGGKLIIKNNVDIAQETNIWTLEHDVHDDFHCSKGGDVIIEDYVWIASRVTILPNITIRKGAVIATNSVVTKDIGAFQIVGGIPAKTIGIRKSNLKYTIKHFPFLQ